MAKQNKLNLTTEIKVGGKNTREKRIKNCKDCLGQPDTEEFNLSDFKGEKCIKCYEIINYEKV
jgi:hypothetical protein